MSYVPKYILKRLVPADGVKKVDAGVEVNLVNVISPIPVSELPGNPLDEIKIFVNGAELTPDQMKSIKITVDEGETLEFENFRAAGNIAVGAKIQILLPTTEYEVGEEVTVKVAAAIVSLEIEFTRTISE